MLIVLIWLGIALICALVGAALAGEKGRAAAGFWLGLLFGPIGIVIALLLSGVKNGDRSAKNAEVADLNALIKTRGKVGIGVSPKDGRTVVTVLDGSPAHASGVKVGDRLIAIDGTLCEGDYRAIVLQLVGTVGSTVQISVRRGDNSHDFVLCRR